MASVLDIIKHYQQAIEKYTDDEAKVLRCIDKLFQLKVTVQHLQETGVGKTVNSLRKEPGEVGQAARSLVLKWKTMVAAEESDQEGDHKNDTSTQNGHTSGRDSDDHSHQTKSYNDRYNSPKISTSSSNDKERHKEINGHHNSSKRKYHSSEEEEHESKKKSRHTSSSEDDKKQVVIKKEKVSDTESSDDSESSDSDSDSYSSESSREEVKIKKEIKQEIKKEKSESPDRHRSSSSKHSHSNHIDHKKESKESSNSRKHESDRYSHHKSSSKDTSQHSLEVSSKSSSNKQKSSSHDKQNSSEKRHSKSDTSSDEKKESSKSSNKHSSDKHKSSSGSHKHDSSSERHKSSDKHSSKEHKSSSDKPEKHKSSSEKDTSKQKSKESSSKENHSSSSKEKSKDRSSSSKDRSSHSSDKKHSSSESKSHSSSSKSKHKSDEGRKEESDKKEKSRSSSHKNNLSSSSKSKEAAPKKKSKLSNSEESGEDGIDCGSGASFAEALGMISPSKPKKKSAQIKDVNSPNNSFINDLSPAALLAPTARLAPLPAIDISALPEISPNYRPRPPPKLLPGFSDEDAISAGISSKNLRTKVYSGNKVFGKVTTLYEMCVHVLQEHIDALEYTGGVPYEILKPVVDRATPQQLYLLEHYNPYLMEDTDHLWKGFCEKSFRNKKRQEMESWREMYMRCQEEQEHRLKSLTANIRLTQEAKKAPIKQTKMAYVDSMVKPPRNIARKQALHGTAHASTASPAARVASLSATPGVLKGGSVRPPPATSVSASSFKPKKAPLMQKALQFMRGRKR